MQNTIVINIIDSCHCDLVSNVDNGVNELVLEIASDISKNPMLSISGEEAIMITSSPFTYVVPSDYYIDSKTFEFSIVDDEHTGDTFTVSGVDKITGNLYLKQVSNFVYTLSNVVKTDLEAQILDLQKQLKTMSSELSKYQKSEDSGWLTPAYADGTKDPTAGTKIRYRKKNGIVYVQGTIGITNYSGSGTVMATLPEGFRPAKAFYCVNTATGSRLSRWIIGAAGGITLEWLYDVKTSASVTGDVNWIGIDASFPVG